MFLEEAIGTEKNMTSPFATEHVVDISLSCQEEQDCLTQSSVALGSQKLVVWCQDLRSITENPAEVIAVLALASSSLSFYIYIYPRTSFHTQAQKQLLVPPS